MVPGSTSSMHVVLPDLRRRLRQAPPHLIGHVAPKTGFAPHIDLVATVIATEP